MRISVLASGSKGNVTYIEKNDTKILIDLGTSSRYVENNLKELKVNPKEIDGIILTHTHGDHIKGIDVFTKKTNSKVYITKEMESDLSRFTDIKEFIFIEDDLTIKDINIKILHLSHDTEDIIGLIIEDSLVYITDTGYINLNHFDDIENKHTYIFESNYDVEKLMNGKYPFFLQQRILSDVGHLSNRDSAYYLSRVIGKNTKNIILAHLSDKNNTEELALNMIEKTLKANNQKVDNIIIAKQNQRSEIIEIKEDKVW